MSRPTIKSVACAGLVFAFLIGCGTDGDSGESSSIGLPKEIIIGATIAKTGYLAPYDETFTAVEQLVKETNAHGGVDGHKVRVIEADTRSEPQQAVIATQQVIEDGADVLFFSGEALTAAAGEPLAEENNELNFSIANEPGYGPPTTGHLSFSSYPSILSEGSAGASFLRSRGVRHPFLFRDTSIIYGKADCSAFEQTWEHLGGTIASEVDFQNSDESVASQVSELRDSDADAVVMCSYPPGGASAIKQIRSAGIDVPIFAAGAFDGTFWLKGISNTKNIYAPSNGSSYDPPNKTIARLFDTLKLAGVATDVSSSLLATYAGGQLILDVIKETGSVNGNVLADALEARPHETIIGKFSYSRDEHHSIRTWPIYDYTNGKPKLVTEVKPQFIPEYGG
ncbi:MAG TPA: ABC transporter substrate-binding protein [Solirubrobacterales bacterium]|nr:ABC transporter substrate-binding protein [Solirubrobacterales bacterium]